MVILTGCTVFITLDDIPVTGISFGDYDLTLIVGESYRLGVYFYPEDATDKSLMWMSHNTDVATVSSDGLVTAVAEGWAAITVTTIGGISCTCSIKVISYGVAVTGVTLDQNTLTLGKGNTKTLTATVTPAEATNQNLTWASSNNAVATVTNGVVTAVSAGTATITVITDDGGYSASCTVTVSPPGIMIMTTSGNVIISLQGIGSVSINWGDGVITNRNWNWYDYEEFHHIYIGTSYHDITIIGENIPFLNCSGNQLTSLNVSNNTALTELHCDDNLLTSLDVRNNIALTYLYCWGNQLTNLDVSNNIALTSLSCGQNQLLSLDVRNNIALTYLYCGANLLTSLDVSNNTALTELSCSWNQLLSLALNALFGTLHSNNLGEEKTISISENPGAESCDRSIATTKGWTFYY